jgi:2-dehydro-3-deoxyphosphooctonate aldolase (KDO 8-P synthase)
MKPFLNTLFQEQSYDQNSFFLMAGPCVVESGKGAMDIASTISAWCQALAIPYVFKASYRKANRTSASSFTGIGDRKALEILQQIRTQIKVPVVTDIHTAEEAKLAAPYVDILQIPAFLCRQTDLLLAAAETGKITNIKKGQFLSGPAMRYAVEKITNTGNEKVLLTERGTTFGYQDLVVDFRNIPWMQDIGVPVVMDVTHALQQPNQSSGVTGGNPQLIGTLAKAAIATGADGLFIETYPNPSLAKSDGANMLPLNQLQPLLKELINIKKAISINVNPQ